MSEKDYVGSELDLFSAAMNWKAYWASHVAPYVRGRVLDVGAGIGATVLTLSHHVHCEWTALEPDATLADRMRQAAVDQQLPVGSRVLTGTLADLAADERFDTILYIDVLEHIEDDGGELIAAAERLMPGGHLLILAPAHQALFSPFDEAIGHFRRYSRRTLQACVPSTLRIEKLRYLDSMGMLASLANRLLLRSAMPTPQQIAMWDRLLIPISIPLDAITLGRIGKSIFMACCRD